MKRDSGGIPWPVWAGVTIIVALLGFLGTYLSIRTQTEGPGEDDKRPSPSSSQDISGTYFLGGDRARVIEVQRLQGDSYRIQEQTSPWPWTGTAELVGNRLYGDASFPKSSATMKVHGTVLGNGAIQVEYKFITRGDGSPAEGKIDRHVWQP